MAQALAQQPGITSKQPRRKMLVAWPLWAWGGAIAALLLISVFVYKSLEPRPEQPTAAHNELKPLPQTASPSQPVRPSVAPVHPSQLADLTLPAYLAPNLRGDGLDTNFEAGMKEYTEGNCRGAIAALALVAHESSEARAAGFYSGACEMRLGNFAQASRLLRKVADAGDSPQQETALYELAQTALAGNDPVTAHAYLVRVIFLRGDWEGRAREQDRRIAELITLDKSVEGKNPATK
jgi:hypothetical protein